MCRASLTSQFAKFSRDTSDARARNCGRRFSDGITKKKNARKRDRVLQGKAGSRDPFSLPGLPRFSVLSPIPPSSSPPSCISRNDITTPWRSSRIIPHPLTIFIPFCIAPTTHPPPHSPPVVLPVRSFLQFYAVSEFFHFSRAVAAASETCEEN